MERSNMNLLEFVFFFLPYSKVISGANNFDKQTNEFQQRAAKREVSLERKKMNRTTRFFFTDHCTVFNSKDKERK